MEEAGEKLDSLGWDKKAAEADITILLPLSKSITVNAKDIGAFVTAEEAAEAAFDYGHADNFFLSGFKYLKSALSGAEAELRPEVDEAAVRSLVTGEVTRIKSELMGSGFDIEDGELLVVKGAKSVELREDDIIELLIKSLGERAYGSVEYEMDVEAGEELDIDELYEAVHSMVADAYYDRETQEIVPSVTGYDFKKEQARRLWDVALPGATVAIPLTVTEPELSTEKAEEMLFGDTLSTIQTSLWGSTQNRIDNITLVCEKINGTVLQPGDSFSYNEALGQRTEEAGFKYAGAYSEGQVVQEIGGGICQVSSMIYYCELMANLQTDVRPCHYFPVGYITTGMDATVSWKKPDFKFTNTRSWPIRIDAAVDTETNSVTVSFIGSDVDGSYVKMTFVSWPVYNNEEFPDIATGYKAATYRWQYDKNDELITNALEAYSEYHYHEEDIEYPETPSPLPTTPPDTTQPADQTPPTDAPPIEATVPAA